MDKTTLIGRTLAAALCVWLGASGGGCTANHAASASHAITISPADARAVTIFRGDGTPATWQDLVSAAASADAVLVGENHYHPLGLAAASALWEDLLAGSSPSKAALALEFFERDEQSRLDDYLTGVTDEATFRKRCNRTDNNYPPGHRAMVEAAKAATPPRPVIAANAPRPYVHLARTEGYDRLANLTDAQRALFRIPDVLPDRNSHYRKAFDDIMEGDTDKPHKPGETPAPPPPPPLDPAAQAERSARHDNGFRAQSLWDWTMAESVAKSIERGNTPTLLVVGRFHVDHNGGLVQALTKLHPAVRTVVVSFIDEPVPPAATGCTISETDRGRGDFLVYVGFSH